MSERPVGGEGLGYRYELAELERTTAASIQREKSPEESLGLYQRAEEHWAAIIAAESHRGHWYHLRGKMRHQWATATYLTISVTNGVLDTEHTRYAEFVRIWTLAYQDFTDAIRLSPLDRLPRQSFIKVHKDLIGHVRIEANQSIKKLREKIGDPNAVALASLDQSEALAAMDAPGSNLLKNRESLMGVDQFNPALKKYLVESQKQILDALRKFVELNPSLDRQQEYLNAIVEAVRNEHLENETEYLKEGLTLLDDIEKRQGLHPYQKRIKAAILAERDRREAKSSP